ncbi:MAG TPA: pyridoxal 5'-phosphate synthase glutaminase subunit PdxT [Candidatus Thermoplasmatota archaeon]|nr:pyridoxal 5'-phosphate synthase glutaminase subunit PdxT [Candidatus Thermoplasmatota archaeon]
MKLGVLGLQGAVSEHVEALRGALKTLGLEGEVRAVRRRDEVAALDGLVMPGGESTTISKLLRTFELHDLLVQRARDEDFPILGTCAGMILLSSDGDVQVEKTETRLLGLMDMAVNRNAFGRQRESFEAPVDVSLLSAPFNAVFIRAPAVTRVWGKCEVLGTVDCSTLPRAADPKTGFTPPAEVGTAIVAARQGNRMGLAFHPELTADTRLHQAFVETVRDWKKR